MIWAGSNVNAAGSFATNATDYGYYFAWSAAQTACPTGWRLPTRAEITALSNGTYTNNTWTGSGMRAAPKSGYGDTSKTLVIPLAGYRSGSGATATSSAGSGGDYWTSTISSGSSAYYLGINSTASEVYTIDQSLGFSVRCVR